MIQALLASTLLFGLLLIQKNALAELTQDEICIKLGEISGQASQLRLDGTEMESAVNQIKNAPEISELGLPDEERIDAAVKIAYMAKMKPQSMRDYFTMECRKDIVN